MSFQSPESLHEAVKVRIKGRVQGVGFRAFTRRNAMLLGLTGEVLNLPDGSVKAHIEGGSDRLMQMLHLIKEGPSLARVDQVDIDRILPTGKYKTFEVGLSR